MRWEFIVALIIAIPIILLPVAFVWYLNIGNIYSAIRRARAKKTIPGGKAEVVTPETTSSPKIHEVQVLRKAGEGGIAEAMNNKASPSNEEANVKQTDC
jgi:hypothetical protein